MVFFILCLFTGNVSGLDSPLFTRDFWEKRGEYFMMDGDWKNSFASFFNALHETAEGSEDQARVLNKIAFLYFYFSKSLGDAEGFYSKSLQIQPYNTTALSGTGDVWFQRGHYQGAMEFYERWLRVLQRQDEKHPDLYQPYFHIGACYYELADLVRAKTAFERALESKSDDPVIWNNLGNIFFDLQEWKNARNAYEKALFYSNTSLWEAAGYFSGRLTHSDEVIAHYKIFADDYYDLRAYSYLESKSSERDGAFLRTRRFSPKREQTAEELKNVKEQKISERPFLMESPETALRLLLSDFLTAHNNLGNLYRIIKEWDLARMHLQRAMELDPDDASVHSNIASLYFDLKQGERARHHLQKAQSLEEHPVYHNNLAAIERFRREFKATGVQYSKALYLNPNYSNARRNGRFFRKRSQNIQEAYDGELSIKIPRF
jgi:tetratricopeptide (TPR) repeat protein